MAISRAELEAMDRDELIETIVDVSQTLADLDARFDAMSTWNDDLEDRLVAVEEENETLREELAAVRESVEIDPSKKDYHEMDRDERVQAIRISLARRAAGQPTNKAAYDYTDVLSRFSDHPSDGYCYKLMRLAAGYDADAKTSRKDGYTYEKRPAGENDRLRVSLADVSDETVIHAVKKEGGS